MAIPHWTWPDGDNETDFAAASEAFDALSDPTRAAVLGALADADGPLAYAELRDAAGVEDNGRLNYHLRRLDDCLADGDDGYALTDRGETLVDALDAATR